LVMGGCAEAPPPRIGIVVSAMPGQAAKLAAAEERLDRPGYFEPDIPPSSVELSEAEQAIEQAYAFVRDPRILAVIGHASSPASLAASQIYNSAGLVQIAPTTTAPVYGQAGPFSFRLVPSDTAQAAYLLMARRHHWPAASRLAVVHVNDDYGRGLIRSLRPMLDGVAFEGMYGDAADRAAIALLHQGITASKADLLIWLGRPSALGLLLPLLRADLPDMAVICSDACDTHVVYSNDDGRFTGLSFVRFTNPNTADSAVRAFQARYLEHTGEVASSEALLTYDAVSLVRAALRDGADTREEVRRYLASLGGDRPAFQGLTGPIKFDASGTCSRSYMLAEVRADSVASAAHTRHYGM
ncbi:MAG: ABC transporter substrate-binding protein, partial [Longimicrobiales bacterium]